MTNLKNDVPNTSGGLIKKYVASPQEAGELLILKSIEKITIGEFKIAASYLAEGYQLITCDCFVQSISKKDKDACLLQIEQYQFPPDKSAHWFKSEYCCHTLCKAYLHLISKSDLEIGLGLLARLKEYAWKDPFINFLGGRFYHLLGNDRWAAGRYDNVINRQGSTPNSFPHVFYRRGRLKEENGKNGLIELAKAFIYNPLNDCCLIHLHTSAIRQDLKLPIIVENHNNNFVRLFNESKNGIALWVHFLSLTIIMAAPSPTTLCLMPIMMSCGQWMMRLTAIGGGILTDNFAETLI